MRNFFYDTNRKTSGLSMQANITNSQPTKKLEKETHRSKTEPGSLQKQQNILFKMEFLTPSQDDNR